MRGGGTSGAAQVLFPASSGRFPGALGSPGKDAVEGRGRAGFSASRAFAFAENGSASPVRSRCGTGECPPVWGLPFFVRKLRT